ncbi:S-adenosyl-L-methionine-dependent methyltransferase [Boletus reticuloceps]|uniref:S-adenosyl-L-methionine-dependent methyltransferase n=1 Tax=Boletus reticuloceps TaxID=495285 RepID=A0A8I2YL91_9AGAM|nr:S-adenosyl-L-methionine-dependent methyltransferase [Boletus reticuloceps]
MAIELNNRHNLQDDDEADINGIPSPGTPNSMGFDDDEDDSSSDTSSILTELGADEFPGHFREHGGRLFHSHGNLPYPLPVDADEQARLDLQHKILRDLLGSHFVGPVAESLAHESSRQKRVLDLCTGTGRWVMDMASQFRHVRFSGVDIVPISTRRPHSNANFEILDVTQPLRWADGVMDFVHARSKQIANYPAMLREAARVLRPGGMFFSGEIGRYVAFAPGYPSNPAVDAPGATRFFKVINDLLERIRLHEITGHIPHWLRRTGMFTGGRIQEHLIPIGEWHPSSRQRALGRAYLDAMTVFAESLKPFLRGQGGLSEREIFELIDGYVRDMRGVPGLVSVYQTVWAIKA